MPPYFIRIANDWVDYFSSLESNHDVSDETNPFHVYEMVVRYEPFWALDLIEATINLDKHKKSIKILIDGPFTELVEKFGKVYEKEILDLINKNYIFKCAVKDAAAINSDDEVWKAISIALD